MIWYYVNGEGKQAGPIDEAELAASLKSGVIHADTLVWKEGLPEWIKYSEAIRAPAVGNAAAGAGAFCSECGRQYPQDEMINFSGAWVCASCKPLYVQKLREGAPTGTHANLFRSGKRLVMPVNSTLPFRCVKCNEATNDPQIKRKLYWHHPAIYLAIFFGGVLVYVILALILRKNATTFVSVCPGHRASRRNAIIVSWLLMLGGIAALSYGIAQSSGWVALAGAFVFLGAAIYGVVRARLVFAARIDKEHVWLGGCKPAFLADFPEWNG